MVPLILVPAILFSGVIVKFDKLHPASSSAIHVPFLGDMMASRWAYEALMVQQFKNNEYEKYFFNVEKKECNITYLYYYFIPELQNNIKKWKYITEQDEKKYKKIVINGLNYYKQITGHSFVSEISYDAINRQQIPAMQSFLNIQSDALKSQKMKMIAVKDSLYQAITSQFKSSVEFNNFRDGYYNERVAEFVLNKTELQRFRIEKNQIVPLYEPIFQDPLQSNGRAHFYSAVKRVGPFYIDTPWFNIITLWIICFGLYVFLIYNMAEKLIESLTRLLKRGTKLID